MDDKNIHERVATLEAIVKTIREDIHELKVFLKKLSNRPSWSVSVVITLLATLCCGLSVYLLTNV